MEKEILKDDKGEVYFTLEELNADNCIYARWIGTIDQEKLQQGIALLVDFVSQSNMDRLLNDNSELRGSWVSFNDWLENEVGPKLNEGGIRKIAHIVSPHFITKFSAIDLETRPLLSEFRLFENKAAALEWLSEG